MIPPTHLRTPIAHPSTEAMQLASALLAAFVLGGVEEAEALVDEACTDPREVVVALVGNTLTLLNLAATRYGVSVEEALQALA